MRGPAAASGQVPNMAARGGRRGCFLVLEGALRAGRPVSSLSIPSICGNPVKKWEKVLAACLKEAVHLPWLPWNRAGFGPTAHIHQPDRVRGGFWFIKCCTAIFVRGGRCC